MAALSACVVAALSVVVARGGGHVLVDARIEELLRGHRGEPLKLAMRVASLPGTATGSLVLVVLLAAFVGWRWGDTVSAAVVLAAYVGASATVLVLKDILNRTSPRFAIGDEGLGGLSFPSAHAAHATVVFGMLLVVIAGHRIRTPPLVVAAIAVATAVTSVGVSRLYLGVHWFTDVVAGIGVGLVWVAALAPVVLYAGSPPRAKPGG